MLVLNWIGRTTEYKLGDLFGGKYEEDGDGDEGEAKDIVQLTNAELRKGFASSCSGALSSIVNNSCFWLCVSSCTCFNHFDKSYKDSIKCFQALVE